MEFELKKYEKFKSHLMFLLVTCGVWPDFPAHSYYFKLFLSFFTALSTGITTCGIVNYCLHNLTNISILMRGLGLMFGLSASLIKLCTLRLHQDELRGLNRQILATFESDLAIPENRPFLLAYTSTLVKMFYVFDFSVGFAMILILLAPLLSARHGKYIRAFPQLLPFTYEPGGFIYWIIYVFEVISAYEAWSISVGADGYFGLYALHIVGEFKLLSHRFQSLKSSLNYKKDLKDCIKRHILLIRAHYKIQKVFGFLAILLAVTCAMVLCSIGYQATQVKKLTFVIIGLFIFYCILKLVQAFSFAWYGNIITVESELCLDSMYNAFWPGSGDVKFMSDVVIVLSQRPLIFKAKGCMFVRLDMFTKIVQTSLSYFFLLRTLESTLS